MDESLKDKIIELADIARTCPDNLQEKCFELLLSDFLNSRYKDAQPLPPDEPNAIPDDSENNNDDGSSNSGRELKESDVHLKVKKFLPKYELEFAALNDLFYIEDNHVCQLGEALKSTKASEVQIHIALLQSLQNAIDSGDFRFNGEDVRKECGVRKCYDQTNFTANFKNNAKLFERFEKYNRMSPLISLSEQGKSELAKLIKSMQA